MAVLALVSAKGSPGVTTAAAALGAAAASRGEAALLVELDPSGGDVAMLCDRIGEAALGVAGRGAAPRRTGCRHGAGARGRGAARGAGGPRAVGRERGVRRDRSLADRWMPTLRRVGGDGRRRRRPLGAARLDGSADRRMRMWSVWCAGRRRRAWSMPAG